MRQTGVTVRDVARAAGISKTTAAYILNRTPNFQVSEVTRQRVLEAADRLGYRRNALAAALSSGRIHTIGVVLQFRYPAAAAVPSGVYFKDVVIAVAQAAAHANLRLTLFTSTADQPVAVQDLADHCVDGLIMASLADAEFVQSVYAAGVPCVELGSGHGPRLVHPDNEGAAAAAVNHLVSLGHRRIAHWCGQDPTNYATRHRLQGFLAAAAQHGLEPAHTPVLPDHESVLQALARPGEARPTAVFAYNDWQACRVLDIARELGLRVPEDLSLVGFDDNTLATEARPMLTTVHNPLPEQAEAAVDLLQTLWHNNEKGAELVTWPVAVPTRLVIRESTARPVAG